MNHINKTAIAILVILLLLITGALRLVESNLQLINNVCILIIFTIHIAMLAIWNVSIRQRVVHSHIRSYIQGIGGLMLFWIFIRTIKHGIFGYIDPAARFLWYCFYISIILIPLLSFLAALCIGKPENWRPERKYNLFFILAALLILGVLTNDYHQLAFSFEPNFVDWGSSYSYQILYFLVAFWVTGFSLATIGLFFKNSYIPHTRKRVWIPLGVIGLGIIYSILYAIDNSKTSFGFIEMTAMLCVLGAALWESSIQTGLIPSNSKHGAFFDTSPLAAQIIDSQGHIHYCSQLAEPVSPELWAALKKAPSLQTSPYTEYNAFPIPGGHVIWQKDISKLAQIIGELRDTGSQLQDGVELLKDEIKAKSRRIHIDEQNRLYDLTLQQTMPQLEKIKSHLHTALQGDEGEKRRLLQEINILAAYIKRCSNLVLIAEGSESLPIDELTRCFRESFENLEVNGVCCTLSLQITDEINPQYALLFYKLFETVIEAVLSNLTALYLTLVNRGHYLVLSIQIESNTESNQLPNEAWQQEKITSLGGHLICEKESPYTYYIALHLPIGGAN